MSPKNIGLFFVGFFFFVVFIMFSFGVSKNSLNQDFLDKITNYETGFFSLSNSSLQKLTDDNLANYTAVYRDSILNTIYSKINSPSDISVLQNGNSKIFSINSGIYIFDINDKKYNYTIKSNYFSFKTLSSGKFFIDNTNPRNIKIFSFDSVLDFDLSDENNKTTYTNLQIYPHMLFSFNSSRNFYLKNADLFRIQSIDNVSYLQEAAFSSNSLNKAFTDKLINDANPIIYSFVSDVLTYINNKNNENKSYFQTIKSSNIKLINGLYYIEKYASVFYNDQKKRVYYKNLILQNLKDLLVSKQKDDSKVDEINSNLALLKDISLDDYESGINLVNSFYNIVLSNNDADNIIVESNFENLVYKLNSINQTNENKLYSYLNSLYSVYDDSNLEESIFSYFKEFINSYFYKAFSIDTDKNSNLFFTTKKLEENIKKAKSMNYFSFLLYNIISNSSSSLSDTYRSDYLHVLNNYLTINNLIISTIGDDKRSLAQVYYNDEIASKILDDFKNLFFEQERDKNNLLVLKNGLFSLNFTNEQFDELSLFFKNLSFFYSRNLSLLDVSLDKDRIVDESYKQIVKYFAEYILAARDYDSYSMQYDVSKRDLLSTKTVAETGNGQVELNRENFIKYMTYFNGVDITNMVLTIEGSYYHVENLSVSGNNFSFDLYPNNSNRLTNLAINGERKTISYKLDSIKENWDQMFKNSYDEETKQLYDFKNFFINTFINKQNDIREIYVDTRKADTEDKAIIILKKDKLLGDKGDFSIIRDFMPISYDNINVTKNGDNYDIKLSGVVLSIPRDNTGYDSSKISVEFSSDYIFTNTDHKFRNIKIKFLNDAMLQSGQKVYDFDGKTFDISFDIDINSFADRIAPAIRRIYNNLSK